MEDLSIFTNSQPKEISEGLQNFIDSMVEEIVLEGKPFDTQKKYLKKFSENEGLDYAKLEADFKSFIEILDSLKLADDKLQVKLAEEKGRECHISETTIDKLIKHSSQTKQTKGITSILEKIIGSLRNKSYHKYGLYGLLSLFLLGLVYFLVSLLSHNDTISVTTEPQVQITDTVVVVKHDTIVSIQYGTEAEQLYRADAERGNATAQFNLGCYFYSGEKGLSQSYAEAVKWYTKAASQGHASAQNNLGYCYEKGFGVDEDIEKAKYWYLKAAEQGNYKAKENLERIEKIEAKVPQKAKALTGTEVGREWVDLGLPSGTRWANMNVGATSPEDYGDYFAWGEIEEKSDYSKETYVHYDRSLKKHCFLGSNISGTKYDVAHEKWGGSWRVPTFDQMQELRKECKYELAYVKSVKGYRFTGPNGHSIFLPAAGYMEKDKFDKDGEYGVYWSGHPNLPHSTGYYSALCLCFHDHELNLSYWWRENGHSVRPVIKEINDMDEKDKAAQIIDKAATKVKKSLGL